MEVSATVRNEQTKLAATAVNNLGVATLVAGVIGPTAGYLFGSLHVDDPLRLLAVGSMYGVIGGFALVRARRLLVALV